MYTQWNTDNRRKHLRAVILLLFHSGALGTHKVRKWLKEALVNHNLICVYTSHLSTKNPAKIFPVIDSYQRIVFLAEELPREGKLPKKGMLYQVFLFSTCNLHETSNQALINAAHPTSYLRGLFLFLVSDSFLPCISLEIVKEKKWLRCLSGDFKPEINHI